MPVLHRDCETYSTLDLARCGGWRYASDPTTGVWCVSYAVDDHPTQLWLPSDHVPSVFFEAARNPDWTVVAHNDAFERVIEELILGPRYGWPLVPIERHRCTMAMALASALPGRLEKVAEALSLPLRKDVDGARLMKIMAKPRKPRRGEDPNSIYWHDAPENIARLSNYCICDTDLERLIYHHLSPLTDAEQALWVLDAKINARGFYTDGPLLEAASRIAAAADRKIQHELLQITRGALNSTDQRDQLLAWLAANGCEVKDITKTTLAHALRRKDLSPVVRRVIELRRDAAHAAASKIDAMLAYRDKADGRIRGTLRFHGTSTGRWTGHGPQPQNFKRDTDDTEGKIAAVATGDLEHITKLYPQPLEVVADIARTMIRAASGHRFLIGDFSGIESRVTAWASDQRSKLEQWSEFDASGDPKAEPYYRIGRAFGLAEEIARGTGKTADLAFGYQGGIGAWDKLSPGNDTSTEVDKKRYQAIWRRMHPRTVAFWNGISRMTVAAVRKPGTLLRYKRLTINCDAEFLKIGLPSGRSLSYPFPRLKPDKLDNMTVVFKDAGYGAWSDCRFGEGAYGGLWTENIVSAIARDLLAAAMHCLEAAGYPVVLHVHDEVVCEVPIGVGSLDEFQRLLTAVPDWAAGLPIAAKVREGERFAKSGKPKAASSPDAGPPMVDGAEPPVPESEEIEAGAEAETTAPTGARPLTEEQTKAFFAFRAELDEMKRAGPTFGAGADADGTDRDEDEPHQNRRSDSHPSGTGDEPDAGKPYGPIRAALIAKGYKLTRSFAFTVPGDAKPLFFEDRYELQPTLTPSKSRPRKACRFWHHKDGGDLNGTGPRRIIYNWPAIMQAGLGATVFITEGANKCDPLNGASLLATAAPYHEWSPECVNALAGRHLIYFEDHDHPDARGRVTATRLSADAKAKLAPGAASFRIVPARHLWKNLGRDGGSPPHGWDIKDWCEAGGEVAKLIDICREIPVDGDTKPIDLWGQFKPPALPRGLLPPVIEQFAFEEGELMGADPAGLALGALAVCAAALPDHTRIQVKRHDLQWLESARLWVGLIGEPSTKKSPIMLRVAKPLKRLDSELFREYLAACDDYESLSAEDRKLAEKPRQRRLRIEDVTVEAAQEVLKDSPDGVLCLQDELSGWFGSMDKYTSHRGAQKDRGFWLQAFHGGPYAVNRIKRGSALIENLSISLLGGIQPEPMRMVAAESVDDGLIQRLIPLVLQPGVVGHDAPTGAGAEDYAALIGHLHESPETSTPYQFSDAALALRAELECKHLDLMSCEVINRKLAAHIGKYDGLFARLCLLWQMIEAKPGFVIEEPTARRVARFMHEFLLPHAFAFYVDVLNLSDEHRRLTAVAGYILAHKLDRVTNRDIARGDRTMRGLSRFETEKVFEQLDALGWVNRVPGARTTDPPHWLVNPEVHRLFVERANQEAVRRTRNRAMVAAMFDLKKEGDAG